MPASEAIFALMNRTNKDHSTMSFCSRRFEKKESDMTFTFDDITSSVKSEARKALADGVLVSIETHTEHGGTHPNSGKPLETPPMFADRLVKQWTKPTVDHAFENEEVDEHIDNVLYFFLPDGLRDELE